MKTWLLACGIGLMWGQVVWAAGPLQKKVLIIGVDGTMSQYLAVARTPNLNALKTNGAFTDTAKGGSADNTNAGGKDIVAMKFKATGAIDWIRQTGTPSDDDCKAVVIGTKGNPVMTGAEAGDFDGIFNAGGFDAFLMSYDANGVKL